MNSGFRSFHPLPCLLYYIGAALLSMFIFHPVFLASSIVLLFALNLMYISRASMLRTVAGIMLIGMLLFVLNPLFSHRGEHILFYMMDQPITLEAIMYGLTISLSTIAILLTFVSYQKVITSDKFLYLFAAIWPKGSLVIVMAMRFVPLLRRRLYSITQQQRSKGISMLHGPLKKRIHDGMLLLQILLTWSLEDALQTADSMNARGYGLGKRSTYTLYRMRRRDWFFVMWLTASVICCIIFRGYGFGQLMIYPSLEPVGLVGVEWLDYAVFILFIGTPIGLEGKEWLRWRYWK
jgi:energy-coupling factor transport system permease protein